MNRTRLLICFSAILWSIFFNSSQAQDLSNKEVLEDLRYLQERILEYQPALDSFAVDFKKHSDYIISKIPDDSLTFIEHYKLVSKLCVTAREGHFSIGTWQDTVHEGIPNNTYRYLPLNIVVLNNKVYLEEDYSNEQQLELGSEIIRMNGTPIAQVLQEMLFCMPSDGDIMTNILTELDDAFPYNYFFFVAQPELFHLELKKPNGIRHVASVRALTMQEQQDNYKKYVKQETIATSVNPVYDLTFTEKYGLLTLRSFNTQKLKNQRIKARKFYKAIFDSIAGAQVSNLIIDLRGNLGGQFVMASELLPFVVEKTPDNRLARKSTSWTGKERSYKFRKKAKHAFNGQIYVLIDGGTFSSASTLARYMKEFTNATIIGEESGSRYEGFAAGSKQYVFLPNSGLRIGIPRYLIEFGKATAQETTNRGVLPNYTIHYSIDDRMQGTDIHLLKAIELMR